MQGILSGSQGKELLRLLSRDGGKTMQQAAQAVRQGDEATAQRLMAPLLQDPQVQKLLGALGQSMGNG